MGQKTKIILATSEVLRKSQLPGHVAKVVDLEAVLPPEGDMTTTADVVVCARKEYLKNWHTDKMPFLAAVAAVKAANPQLEEAEGLTRKAIMAYLRTLQCGYTANRAAERIGTFKVPHVRDSNLAYPQADLEFVAGLVSNVSCWEHKNVRNEWLVYAKAELTERADAVLAGAAKKAPDPILATDCRMETAAAGIDSSLFGWTKKKWTDDVITVHFSLDTVEGEIVKTAIGKRESQERFAWQAVKDLRAEILHLWRTRVVFSGISYAEKKYRILTATPGQQRKDEAYFVEETLASTKQNRLLVPGGYDAAMKAMAENGKKLFFAKFMQYIGLGLSTSVPSSRTRLGKIRLRELVCLSEPEGELLAHNVINVVNGKDGVYVDDPKESEMKHVKPGDGSVIFIQEHMPESATGMCVQIRAQFGIKGCGSVVPLLAYLNNRKYKTTVVDVDGVEVDVADETIKGIVTPDEWKTQSFFRTWREFVRYAEEAGCDEVYIAGDNTHTQKGHVKLSNQMVQSLWCTPKLALKALARYDIEKCQALETMEGAHDAMASYAKPWEEKNNSERLFAAVPSLLNTAFGVSRMRDKKRKEFYRLMSGSVKVPGIYVFVQPDWTAFADITFGSRAFSEAGSLRAGEVACNSQYLTKGDCVLERSPHAGDEHVLATVIPNHKWLNTPNVAYVSYHDFTLWRLGGADCDGDHVYVTQQRALVTIVRWLHRKTGDPLVWWDGLSGEKIGLPATKPAYNKAMVDTLNSAFRYNLIGAYSARNRVNWMLYDGTTRRRTGWQIQAFMSWAVDAVKTGYLPDETDLIKDDVLLEIPDFVRYRTKVDLPHGKRGIDPESLRWCFKGQLKTLKGTNSIDKLGEAAKEAGLETDWHCDAVSELVFKWGMLQNRDARFNIGSVNGVAPKDDADSVLRESSVAPNAALPKKTLGYLLSLLADKKPIGMAEYFRVLTYSKAANINKKAEEEDPSEEDAELKQLTERDTVDNIRCRMVEFAKANNKNGKLDGFSNDDILRYIANVLLRNNVVKFNNVVRKWKEANPGKRATIADALDVEKATFSDEDGFYSDFPLQSLFECFGDLYAEAYLKNESEGYNPKGRFVWEEAANLEQAPESADSRWVPPETTDLPEEMAQGIQGAIKAMTDETYEGDNEEPSIDYSGLNDGQDFIEPDFSDSFEDE